ncbi:MAG: diaminopimelate decarboxylase [Hyphomicrobiales bacterium]
MTPCFRYRSNSLHAEDVALKAIADAVGTPFYCYSTAALTGNYSAITRSFSSSDHLLCYSVKANSNQAVLKTLAGLGAGADIVSQGELHRALAAGMPAERTVFSGVGKTREEMIFALGHNILCFNIESKCELVLLNEIAVAAGRRAPVAIRINPDIDAGTHEKISTGRARDKFGISWRDAQEIYAYAASMPMLEIKGIDMHIGSQILELEPFETACRLMAKLVVKLRGQGHAIEHVDIGGGLGIAYRDSDREPETIEDYSALVRRIFEPLKCRIILEPGRFIAGNAGVLVTRVIYIKHSGVFHFVIVDAAMNDLARPALYDVSHEIRPVIEPDPRRRIMTADVVGPVCESGDCLAKNYSLPEPKSGDLLAIMCTGAYGAVLSGTYNTRRLVSEVLVHQDRFSVVRERLSYEAIIDLDALADWQS